MVGDARQGLALMIAMLVLLGCLAGGAFVSEQGATP